MPYTLVKEEDQFCVHKENADGSAGEKVKCHPSEAEAKTHMRALYANMEGKASIYENLYMSVKAIGSDEDWRLETLGVPFYGPKNGKDKQGEYFHDGTNIHEKEYPEIPVNYFHTIDMKTGKPTGDPIYIGKAKYLRKDGRGHWYEVVLDKTKELAERVWKAAKVGMAAASSEALSHLVRTQKDGRIDNWPVAGMAVLDVGEGRAPINSYAVALPMMKAIYEQAGLSLPDISENDETQAQTKASKIARKNIQKQARAYLVTIDNKE